MTMRHVSSVTGLGAREASRPGGRYPRCTSQGQGGTPAIGGEGVAAAPSPQNFSTPQYQAPTRRLIGYTRVSTREQAEEGHSLAAQRYRLEAYCVAHNCVLIDVCEDAGATASNLDRPGLQGALMALREGKADGLVVTKLDRLTRSIGDFAELLDEYFREYELASLGDNIDTATATGRLVLNVLMSVSQWEREMISERTKEGLAQARRAGVRLGRPRDGRADARIRELWEGGLRNLSAIARQLDAEGIRPPSAERWSHTAVRMVLGR